MAETKRRTPAVFRPETAITTPRHERFQFVEEEAARPVIAFRYGRDVLAEPEAFVAPRVLSFPYFQAEAVASFIPFLYGRWIGEEIIPITPAAFLQFPYFQEAAPAAANPIIPFIRGQWLGDAVQPHEPVARHLPFPFVSPPTVGVRVRRLLPLIGVGH